VLIAERHGPSGAAHRLDRLLRRVAELHERTPDQESEPVHAAQAVHRDVLPLPDERGDPLPHRVDHLRIGDERDIVERVEAVPGIGIPHAHMVGVTSASVNAGYASAQP
jgi:hypothetical protein